MRFGNPKTRRSFFIQFTQHCFLLVSNKINFIFRPRPRVYAGDTSLVNDLYVQIIHYQDLARKASPFIQVRFRREYGGFVIADRSRVAAQNFNAARCTPGIAAAPVKYIYTGILDRQNKPLVLFSLERDSPGGSFRLDVYHQKSPQSFLQILHESIGESKY
jgi:hypothetical protein